MTVISRIILRIGQIIENTALAAKNNDFALVGFTGVEVPPS